MTSEIQLFDRRCINLHLELGRANLVVVRCGTGFCYEAEWWRWGRGIPGLDRVEYVASWDWDGVSGGCVYCLTDTFVHMDGIFAQVFVSGCVDGPRSYIC